MTGEVDKGQVSAVELSFESAVYSLTAIKKAAYRMLADGAVEIREADDRIECKLVLDRPSNEIQAEAVRSRFHKEVLDQDLREIVGKETEAMRNLVLGYAFSRTGLTDQE